MMLLQAGVFVDRSAASRFTNTTTEGGPIPIPAGGVSLDNLQLQIFLDR